MDEIISTNIDNRTIAEKTYTILEFKLCLILNYGYSTKRFNEQVKNNTERFDEDFRF